VIVASGRRFGKTPQHMRVWWLGMILSLCIPTVAGTIVAFHDNDLSWRATWTFLGLGFLGYSMWFHIRTSCLRPHIRAYLAENDTPSSSSVRQMTVLSDEQGGAAAMSRFSRWAAVCFLVLACIVPVTLMSFAYNHRMTMWTFLPGPVFCGLLFGVGYLRVRRRGMLRR